MRQFPPVGGQEVFVTTKTHLAEFKCNKDSYIEITIKQKGKIN
jgi:hypothetical protein